MKKVEITAVYIPVRDVREMVMCGFRLGRPKARDGITADLHSRIMKPYVSV